MRGILEIFKNRRSIYALGNKTSLSRNQITSLVGDCVKYAPSAFNSQSGRAVILFDQENQKFWHMVLEHLRPLAPADKFAQTENKIASFAAGGGTILFFEDQEVITALEKKFPLYKAAFEKYSYQSSGMLQYMVWTALSANNIGASLQHYNPLIDDDVKQMWQLPVSWRLMSQMPFGAINSPADDKDFLPLDDRVKIFA